MGAIFGGGLCLLFNDSTSIFLLPLMILFGAIGGAFWATIPALLKTKFNTNEILTSLMLTYVLYLYSIILLLVLGKTQLDMVSQNQCRSQMLEDYRCYLMVFEFTLVCILLL